MTVSSTYAYIMAMKYLTAKNIPLLAILVSGGLLGGAWFFQYGLGYPPCQMCYWQRHAHKAVLVLAVLALGTSYLGKKNPRLFATLIGLAFVVSFGLAFWHVGVEYKWWEGPKTCSGTVEAITNIDPTNLFDDPSKLRPPACTEAPWHFLGLSMAAWNAAISALGAIGSFIGAKRFD